MALSTRRFVLGRVVSVVIVIVGVTGLTWLVVNALRPDLRARDDRFIFVASSTTCRAPSSTSTSAGRARPATARCRS
jgi:hypothetical protein